MFPSKYIIPNNYGGMYRNTNGLQTNSYAYDVYPGSKDDRFLLAPFVFGGLAGTALGFGIANNKQLNNRPPCCNFQMIPYYPPQNPTFYNSNSFYY